MTPVADRFFRRLYIEGVELYCFISHSVQQYYVQQYYVQQYSLCSAVLCTCRGIGESHVIGREFYLNYFFIDFFLNWCFTECNFLNNTIFVLMLTSFISRLPSLTSFPSTRLTPHIDQHSAAFIAAQSEYHSGNKTSRTFLNVFRQRRFQIAVQD